MQISWSDESTQVEMVLWGLKLVLIQNGCMGENHGQGYFSESSEIF